MIKQRLVAILPVIFVLSTTMLSTLAFLSRSAPYHPPPFLCTVKSGSRCFMTSDAKETAASSTTLAPGLHEAEMEVKKSRFIGYAQHVTTWKDAQDFLNIIKEEHPKSRHIAFGFVAGSNPVQERCSDDGEPTGTAGLPVLGGIKGEELSDVVCAVVRYFGGVKLGAGGLIRAYGGAARLVLREAPKEVLIPRTSLRVCVLSHNAGAVYDAAAKVGGSANDVEYTADGELVVTVTCDLEQENRLRQILADATRGNAEFLQLEDNVDS
jgi:uncharacterized YigZ family protein